MSNTRSPYRARKIGFFKSISLAIAWIACCFGVTAAGAQDSPLGTAKDVLTVIPASSGTSGNFDIGYRFTVAATGDKSLTLLSMTDDMTSQDQLGSAFVRVVPPGVSVVNIDATRPPLPSQSYNGTNKLLASSENDLVEPGQSFEIRVTVEVNPDASGAPDVLRNQGFASAFNTDGGFERDITDSGANPGGTNPGAPGDTGGSDDPTPLEFGSIGLAKEVVSIEVSDTNGNFDVRYRFVTENTGDFDLDSLSLIDDMTAPDQLGSAFIAVVDGPTVVNVSASNPPAPNPGYSGTGDLLNGSPADLLEPGQVFEVFVTVELDPDAPGAPARLDNQGLVSGTSPAGNTVKDLSDTGSDPGGNNPGAPGDTGGSDDPTPVELPGIGVAKRVGKVRAASSGVRGNWDIGYFITVRNTGSTTLSGLSLIDDMTRADRIGDAFVRVVAQPRVRNIDATDPPAPNPGYDGSGDLLNGSPTDRLEPGQSFQVGVIIEVDPSVPGANDPLLNQALALGTDESGVEVKDNSDSGSDPTGTNPGAPGDTGGSDDPTPSRFPDIGLAKFVSDSRPNGSNTDLEFTLVIENTGSTTLSQLILLDDMTTSDRLGSAFVGVSVAPVVNNIDAASPPLPNPAYDGTGDLINGSAADQLNPGERFEVIVVVEIDPTAPGAPNPLANQAIVRGTDGQGLEVTDRSDSGSDPDGTNPGEPGDTGGSDDPTPILLPQIGLAKEVAGVEVSGDNFDVTYSFVVGNTGTTDLSNLALLDDMSSSNQLGSSFVAVSTAPQVVNIDATSPAAPNGGYDGTGDLLDGSGSDLLEPGQSFQVLVTIEVDPNAAGAPASLFNQGLAQGIDESGIPVEDPSDTGADPNGTNPGEPGDLGTSDDPTPLALPDIGLAKVVTAVNPAATEGHFEVGYTFVAQNTGSTQLSSLSLLDDMTAADQLGSAFVTVIGAPEVDNIDATSPPVPNGRYDGTNDLLSGSAADRLAPGQSFQVTVVIEVNPNAPGAPMDLVNQGEVFGTDPNDVTVSDPSDTGTDPDGTNPGEPGDTGGSDDPTPIAFPDIGLAKFVSAVTPNGSNIDIELTLVVENTGSTTLSQLVLLDNMTTADRLGSAFVGVTLAPVVNNIDATSPPAPNPGYDGTGDLLNGSAADDLEPGQSFQVVVVVEADPAAAGAPDPLVNQAFVEGTDPQGLEVSDLSDSGADPDGTNPGEPGDTGGSDDPTPIPISDIGVAKSVAEIVANGENFDVTYSIIVENTGSTELTELTLIDDMTPNDRLGTAFIGVSAAPVVVNIDATSPPDANLVYDGTNDLIEGSLSDLLEPGQRYEVLVTVEIDPDAVGVPDELLNQATTTGLDPNGVTVTDDSDSGDDPGGTNPGEPGDTGGADDPTPVSFPDLVGEKSDELAIDADGDGVVSPGDTLHYTVVITNLGDGDATSVLFEDTPDGNTGLVVGSVTSSPFGDVLVGNDPGDSTVTVDVGTMAAADVVTVEFDVLLDDPLTPPAGPGRILLSEQLDPTVLYEVSVATQEATFVLDYVSDDRVHAVGLCSSSGDLLYGIGKLSAEVVEVDLFQKPAVERSLGTLPAQFINAVVQLTCNDENQLVFTNALTDELVILDLSTCPSCDPEVIDIIETDEGLGDVEVDGADMAFLPNGMLYLLTNANGGELWEVDPVTARATFVGIVDTPEGNHGLAGTAEGRLIIASNDDRLYEIHPATAAVTDLGTVTLDGVDLDLGFGDAAAAPERVTSVANQGVISSALLGPIVTDDPDTLEIDDATVTLIGNCPELLVVQTDELLRDVDSSGDVSVGDVLRFTATIVSSGNQPEEQVVYLNQPDEHLELVVGSVEVGRGEVLRGLDEGDALIDVALGSLQPGDTAEVTFAARVVSADRRQRVTNQAFVGSDHSPRGVASDDPRTPVKGDPTVVMMGDRARLDAWNRDRLVSDSDGDGVVSAGDVVRYMVTVENFGGEPVETIRIADRPGSGGRLIPGSVVTTAGNVEAGNYEGDAKVWITIPSLAPANSVTLSFDLLVDEGATGLSNQAQVRARRHPRFSSDDPETPQLDDATETQGIQ